MQIHEVETKVGLTKKSIRYYEEEGLLKPKRNTFNDYRDYTEEDINTLKLIKFLRNLNVSVNEIKKLKNNELSLEECLKERIDKINNEEHNLEKIKNMCLEIIMSKDSFENIDITKYSLAMNILNKEGFTMKDVSKKHMHKILGAILSSISFSAIFIFLISIISYFYFTENEGMPFLVYLFIIIILGFPVLSIIINLFKRIKEIKGGEEDEASKY